MSQTETKVGISQVSKNAPWWWKRIETAFIAFFLPGYTTFILAVDIPDSQRVWFVAAATFFGMLLKGIGVILGEEVKTTTTASVTETTDKSDDGK